jgi:hypothetical protein
MNLQPARRNPNTMNATASAQAVITRAMRQPAAPRAPTPASDPSSPGVSPRLPVWEERARKMGFPPSQR